MSAKSVYRLLLWAVAPLLLFYVLAPAVKRRSLSYALQRFGFRLPATQKKPLWIHAASVGETNVALTLAYAWLQAHPDDAVLLTSATASSRRLFEQKARPGLSHCFLPLDYPSLCRRFLKKAGPRCALIVETEIWLNLFAECEANDVPVIIVNARLSNKTLSRGRRVLAYYRESLKSVRAVLAKSAGDCERFIALGAAPERTETVGNLKCAVKMPQQLPNLVGRPYCLAASTHGDEELRVAEAWRRSETRELLLVVAPRHPQRTAAIARRLQRAGFTTAICDGSGAPGDADIHLFNGIGRLPALMKHAQLVFLGGSLVDKGGHNLFEAALLETPQVTGPHLENVAEEARMLEQAGGLMVVQNPEALCAVFAKTAAAPGAYRGMAANAAAAMRSPESVVSAYIAKIEAVACIATNRNQPASPE